MKNRGCSNWFFVESPLQLINAFEALHYFSLEHQNNIILIRRSSSELANKQLEKTLQFYDVSKVHIIYIGELFPKLYFFNVVTIIFKILSQSGMHKFYIGEYNALWARIFPYLFSKSFFILFDDGSATIALHQYEYDFSKYRASSKWKKFIKVPILKLLYGGARKVTLFTMFDLKPYPSQKVFKNSFAFLKQKLRVESSNPDLVYFIGGNWVESNEVKKEDYLLLLTNIFKIYTDQKKKIIYIPHRKEKLEKFNGLRAMFDCSLEIITLDVPVEIYFLHKKEKPINIGGFGSTALFTLGQMYTPKDLISYRIPRYMLAGNLAESTGIITSYYEALATIDFKDINVSSNR